MGGGPIKTVLLKGLAANTVDVGFDREEANHNGVLVEQAPTLVTGADESVSAVAEIQVTLQHAFAQSVEGEKDIAVQPKGQNATGASLMHGH